LDLNGEILDGINDLADNSSLPDHAMSIVPTYADHAAAALAYAASLPRSALDRSIVTRVVPAQLR